MAEGSQRPRVLLADDHDGMQIAVRRLLSASCDVVGCVPDSAALVDAVAQLRPQVVLLELSLPGDLQGFDICQLITSRTPDVKVVIFTGHDDANLESRAREAGASGYVWKLRATDQLLRTIHAVVDGTPPLTEPHVPTRPQGMKERLATSLDQSAAKDVRLRLAAIVDGSDDAIISKNLDGVISAWNPAAERIFGYAEAEAVGEPITFIIPADLHDEEKDILRRVRLGERIERYETRRVTKDGRILDVSLTISPLKDAAGAIVGASKILRDVTESKRARAALRESEERFRLIANTAPVIIWMSDVTKGCSYVNQTWLDLTGQSFDAVLGKGWTDRIYPSDIASCFDIYARAFDRRDPFQIEFRLRRRDGEYRWIVSNGVPRYYGDGSFAGYIGSALDITERRLATDALATIQQRLFDAQEEERAHIARELHDDVMQRLAVMSISLGELARDTPSPVEVRRKIDEAREEVVTLANDVQALSHRLHPSRLECLGIAAASAALCREISNQRGLDISFIAESIPDGLPTRIAVAVYRVLQEALQNAIKHGGAARIDASLRGSDDRIELTVRDFGTGFDVSATNGSGLGLTSMKERLKAVHGRLTILSEAQKGTTIHALVPL